MPVCTVDLIIGRIFRYSLLLGLTTHTYNSELHKLVHSPTAHCYSLSIHIVALCLLPVFHNCSFTGGYGDRTERRFIEQQFLLLTAFNFLAILSSIVSQWTSRSKAAALFNEIIQMWHTDMAHLQGSCKINRHAVRLLAFRIISTSLIVANAVFGCFANKPLSVVQGVCLFVLCNIIIAVMFQFTCGIIFSWYLFRVLNWNLARLVGDIDRLRHTTDASQSNIQHSLEELDRELSSIGEMHTRLQKWVVEFKNMYQVELLFILLTFFASQTFTLFLLCSVLNAGSIVAVLPKFLTAISTSVLCGLDLMLHFYTCGRLLEASHEAAEILKELPSDELACIRLERFIEVMCLELKHNKLRLSICGLVDLQGNTGFTMAEAAMMCILLLIQIDYENF